MTTTPLDSGSRALEGAKDALVRRMRADVDLLVAAAEWAVLHPATEATGYAGFGDDHLFDEGPAPLAGDGAPLVAEFAPAELAAVLGWSTETVKELMGDALELQTRLPRVWEQVTALHIPVPVARYIAAQTRDLDSWTAHDADRMLAARDPGSKLTRRQAHRVIDEQRLHADPDRAVEDERQAAAARKVELRPGATPATTDVAMSLDTAHAEAFDAAASRLAQALRDLGDPDEFDILRARAVGIMADPRSALDLLHRDRGPTTGATTRSAGSRGSGGSATLFLHLDLATLADLAASGTTGPVWDERHGTATTDLIRRWLTGWLGPEARIRVQPYLDLDDGGSLAPVDGHDPTGAMVDLVRLRDPLCVFPGCKKPSRRCDLDHIEPYVPPDRGGPPGQTHPDNLAPLCRHHHRVKTHGRWTYRRLPGRGYRWTTPTGHTVDVRSVSSPGCSSGTPRWPRHR